MENKFSYQEAAAQKAGEANRAALEGRKHRDRHREDKAVLDAWAGVMSNAHPVTATVIAVILALLNMVAAWEMNRDLIDQSGIFNSFGLEKLPLWAPLIIALPLEALAFWVASWLGKAYNDEIFELGVWNRIHLTYKGDYHRPLAVEEVQKSRSRARFWFWLLLVLVLTVQGSISWHRIQILEDNEVGVILAVLAFVFLLGEIVAGVYADYLLKRWRRTRSCKKDWTAFRRQMVVCVNADRMTVELIVKGREKGEPVPMSGEIKRAVYRHKLRAQDEESYLDEISIKQATVEVRTDNEAPVSNAHVVGLLPDGTWTNAGYTDGRGSSILHWHGVHDVMHRIKVNGFEFLGPFGKDMVHRLRLPLPPGKQPLALTGS